MESSRREQDGGGVGGPTHQEYTLGNRSVWRTPAESGQEYLTVEKKI